jgi:hypothetical protein
MNIKQLSETVTYYNNLTDTFAAERDMLRDAGIWSLRGLWTPLEDTDGLWSDGVGSDYVEGNEWTLNNEISVKRSFETQLKKFDKIINDCISEYKQSHSIASESPAVSSKHVTRYKKGHNLSTYSVGSDGYTAIFYLNNDYVGGQVSFTTKKDTSIDPLVHPKYPNNVDQIDFWIKPENFSVLIFPSSHKITEHVITSWDRYNISAGF